MNIKDVLASKGRRIVTTWPNRTVRDALKILDENKIGSLVIIDADGKLVGLVSDRALLMQIARSGNQAFEQPLSMVMQSLFYLYYRFYS